MVKTSSGNIILCGGDFLFPALNSVVSSINHKDL